MSIMSLGKALSKRGFFWGVLIGVFCWSLGWAVLIFGQLGRPHPDNAWVIGVYDAKIQAIENIINKPKLLIVGGSASLFGIDSSTLSKELGMPSVNFGTNAGVGTHALPDKADAYVGEGDLILMPLEYRLLLWDGFPSYVTLSWALQHPSDLLRWNFKSLMWGFWHLPAARVWQGYSKLQLTLASERPYGPHRINHHGDQILTEASERSKEQWLKLIRHPPERYDEYLSASTYGLNLWEYYWRRWQARGACLLVIPPPFLDHSSYHTPASEEFFDGIPERVRSRGVDYLGKPQDVFFPVEAMFDTNYHLTDEGRSVYTRWILDMLDTVGSSCLPLR